MIEDRYEKLRCPKCGKTGMATVVQPKARKTPAVQSVPKGFEVVKTRKGAAPPSDHAPLGRRVVLWGYIRTREG
jgi:hypothetical protein